MIENLKQTVELMTSEYRIAMKAAGFKDITIDDIRGGVNL